MPSHEQVSTELKHISLLRKLLTGGHSVRINFDGGEWRSQLKLANGVLESTEEAVPCLANIFSYPVFRFSWENSPTPLSDGLDPKLAFYRALVGLRLDDNYLQNYQQVFSKLPPVHVKAGTLFRLNMEDMKHYKILYQLGLGEHGVRISDYLNVQDRNLLLRRVRIVLTCYCLGQFLPAAAIEAEANTSKKSMARRILARLRRQ